jgi:hypothetical protein
MARRGKGGGAADGGRDLEAHFLTPTPDGEIVQQKWWVEAKGRSGTVNPIDVKAAVLGAGNRPDLDVLIVATNTTFSNPTRDWVSNWQSQHPRPVIRLWERSRLEKLLSEYPSVVVRLFSKALSKQGRLEVIRYRVWNFASLASNEQLLQIWRNHDGLNWSPRTLFAVIASEFANGDINQRPWGMTLDTESLAATLAMSLLNVFYICKRADDAGISQRPYLRAIAYLILVTLDRTSPELVNKVIKDTLQHEDGTPWPEAIRRYALEPVLRQLLAEITDVCTSDCARVLADRMTLAEGELNHFWDRLRLPREPGPEAKNREERSHLVIELHDKVCEVGFPVTNEMGCPLRRLATEPFSDDLLATIKRVSDRRKVKAN